VAAMLVETEERQIERDLMHAIGALRAEVHALHKELRDLREMRNPEKLVAPADKGPAPVQTTDTDPV
jgi:hypothetical protein